MSSLRLPLVLTIVTFFSIGTQAGDHVMGVLVPQGKSAKPIVLVPHGKSAAITEEKILAKARSVVPDEIVLSKSAAAADLPIKVGRTLIGTTGDFPYGLLITPNTGRTVTVDGHLQKGKSIVEQIKEKQQQQQGKAILKVLKKQKGKSFNHQQQQQQQQQGKAILKVLKKQKGKSFNHQQQQQQQQQRAYSRRRGHRQRDPSSESSESGSGSSSSSSESYERPSRFHRHGRGLSTGK